jgi:uncharacterized protein YfcZ (UPF0381/DUF406 family)
MTMSAWNDYGEALYLPAYGNSLWAGGKQILLVAGRTYAGKLWESKNGKTTLVKDSFGSNWFSSDTVIDPNDLVQKVSSGTLRRVTTELELLKYTCVSDDISFDNVNLKQSYFTLDKQVRKEIDALICEQAEKIFSEKWLDSAQLTLGLEDADYSAQGYNEQLDDYLKNLFQLLYTCPDVRRSVSGLHLFEVGKNLVNASSDLVGVVIGEKSSLSAQPVSYR